MSFEFMARIAEQKIQEAIEEGAFDNLPGKGKPLVFNEDPSIPLAERLANNVLKNAGVLPEWMQAHKDLLRDQELLGKTRLQMANENRKRRGSLTYLPSNHPEVVRYVEWRTRSRNAYLSRLKSLNSLLLKLSMIAPASISVPGLYKIDVEMAIFDEEVPSLENAPMAPPEAEMERENPLLARVRNAYAGGELDAARNGVLKMAQEIQTDSDSQG